MRRACYAITALLVALSVGTCGEGGAVADGPALVEELAASDVECDNAGFASQEEGATGPFDGLEYTEVQRIDVGACDAFDEPLSVEVFPEGEMDQVREDAEAGAADEQDAYAIGPNWVVIGDPPAVGQLAEATGVEFLE